MHALAQTKTLLNQAEIAAAVDDELEKTPDLKTLRDALKAMAVAGLVSQPMGIRKGYQLTPQGKALALKTLAA